MAAVRLTNRTSMTINLEDMSLVLHPSGGRDSSAIVDADLYVGSKDAKRYKSWIVAEFLAPTPVASQPHVVYVPSPPAPVDVPVDTSVSSEIESLHSTIREMDAKMSILIDIISRQPQVVYSASPGVSSPSSHAAASEEIPVFIPSSILPKDADAHIRVSEKNSSDEGFDDSAEALRNLRRKPK